MRRFAKALAFGVGAFALAIWAYYTGRCDEREDTNYISPAMHDDDQFGTDTM